MIYVDENLPKGGKNVTFKKQYSQSLKIIQKMYHLNFRFARNNISTHKISIFEFWRPKWPNFSCSAENFIQ